MKILRCHNDDIHIRDASTLEKWEPGEGNILMFIDKNSIYIKCSNHLCKRWNQIEFRVPDGKIDLTNAGIVQRLLPHDHIFTNTKKASVIYDK